MSRNAPTVTSPPWDTTTKRIVALLTLVALFFITRQIQGSAWTVLILSVVLAYLLSPVVTLFEQRLKIIGSYEIRRSIAVVLSWLVVLGVFGLGIGLIIPATVAQLREFADDLPGIIEDTEGDLRGILDRPITIGRYEVVPWQEIQNAFSPPEDSEDGPSTIADTLQNAVLSLADPALGVVGGIVTALVNTFFVLVLLFYMMRDGPLFVSYLVGTLPESYQGDARLLLHELGRVWNAYLRGQLLLCTAIGVATYFAALILGLPQPLLLGIFAGFLEFIPNIGPALSQIPALLFALTTDSATIPGLDAGLLYAVIVSLTYIVIQNLEAVFLVPRILGSSLDLHPSVVLIGVLVGAGSAGLLGVVLAAPTIATLRVLLRYVRGKLLDEDAFAVGPGSSTAQRGLIYALLRYLLSKRFPTLPAESGVQITHDAGGDTPREQPQEPPRQHPDMSGWMGG